MFINTEERLHPNLIKISMLLTLERTLGKDSKTLKAIKSVKLNEDSNAFAEFTKVMSSDGLSDNIIINLITDCCSLLLSLENPSDIIGEYIYSYEVMSDIRGKINSYNNNKNSYDLNAILNNFKEFILRYSITSYDLNSDNLKAFLCNAYGRFYSKDEKYRKDILDVLNAKGSVVDGEEGSMSLSDKIGFSDESKNNYQIDFPSIVKDITIASDVLFNISNEVVYDLFSFYKEETSKSSYNKIRDLFLDNLGSTELLPIIFEKKTTFSTKYTENTVSQRYLMLKRVSNLVDNGLFSDNVESLFQELKSIDMKTIGSANVSTLFKYPKANSSISRCEAIETSNRELFLKILKGVVSLKEFVKYLKLNKIEFSDGNLFRNKNNYRRFSTLESYISLNKISESLLEESRSSDIELPYYENYKLYDVLSQRYNLSSLSSIYNEHLSKMYSEQDVTSEYLETLYSLISISMNSKARLEEEIENLRLIGEDPASEVSFEYITENFKEVIEDFSFYFAGGPSSEDFKEALLNTKNIYNILRLFDFSLVVFDHLACLIELTTLSNDKLFFTDKLEYLDFPREITCVDDLAKIKSDRFKLSFYREESPEFVDDYISVSKLYCALFEVISVYIMDIVNYADSWVYKFKEVLRSYGISIVKSLEFSNIKLRSKLVSIESLEENLTSNFIDFVYRFKEVNGLLFDNGLPIVYEGYLVHSKGYLLSTFNDFAITKINESQTFNLKKVEPWRGVLWKV